jgi:heme oxygenase
MVAAARATTMAHLHVEAGVLHGLDAELELFDAHPSWLDYRLFLFRMYGFHASAERALGATPGLTRAIPDAKLRNNKVTLLAHDLVSLGVERQELARLPRMPVPVFRDLPTALGWMYVLEASTLRGRLVAEHLATRLSDELASASAYLACYGKEVDTRWIAFGTELDAFAAREGTGDRIVASARDCRMQFHRWIRPSAAANRLHA